MILAKTTTDHWYNTLPTNRIKQDQLALNKWETSRCHEHGRQPGEHMLLPVSCKWQSYQTILCSSPEVKEHHIDFTRFGLSDMAAESSKGNRLVIRIVAIMRVMSLNVPSEDRGRLAATWLLHHIYHRLRG